MSGKMERVDLNPLDMGAVKPRRRIGVDAFHLSAVVRRSPPPPRIVLVLPRPFRPSVLRSSALRPSAPPPSVLSLPSSVFRPPVSGLRPPPLRPHGTSNAADTVAGPSPAVFTGTTVSVTSLPLGSPCNVTAFSWSEPSTSTGAASTPATCLSTR